MTRPSSEASGTDPIATALPTAHTIISGRRRVRSTMAPAGSDTSSTGSAPAALSAATSNLLACRVTIAIIGTASQLTWVPNWSTVCPLHSSTKSRCRHSDPPLFSLGIERTLVPRQRGRTGISAPLSCGNTGRWEVLLSAIRAAAPCPHRAEWRP